MIRTYDSETWVKIGQPDLGSKMFMKKKNGEKVWGSVSSIDYSYKGKVRIGIDPFKKSKEVVNG